MPRPCKRRRICAIPACGRFEPVNSTDSGHPEVTMTLDEFECIRLIDLEGMNQEQCAGQMNISRTTAQAIYVSARRKLARCLVNERPLNIAGGDYVLCDGKADGGCAHCNKRQRMHR